MKKFYFPKRRYFPVTIPAAISKAMRITAFLLFVCALNVHAKSYSQDRLTLNLKDVKLSQVFAVIQQKTDYQFLYNTEDVQKAPLVSISVKKATVPEILADCFEDFPLTYRIENKTVVVVKKVPLKSYDRKSGSELETAEKSIFSRSVFTNQLSVPPLLQRVEFVVKGKVTDESGNPLVGVSVTLKGNSTRGTTTDENGNYSISLENGNGVLMFSAVGHVAQEVEIGGHTTIDITLRAITSSLEDVVVVGYGTQKQGDITSAISTVTSKDIDKVHGGSTVSTSLAGKISGLSFRQAEGRPGASAGIQIRNMGTPLYVIDGVVKDEGQFNNLSPNDIESISILKDASAAIYGVRAANGVVVVTTKGGKLNEEPTLKIDTYAGWQNMTRYPNKVVDAYHWQLYAAEAQLNQNGNTSITPEEIEKWKLGTDYGYQSFNWADFIFRKNAPQTSLNASVSGGGEKTNYYFSITRLNQDAVFKQYNFNRTNMQSNITSRIGNRLKVGMSINGRIEDRVNPGVPGGDDYWEPLFATMRNTPMEHPFANNNPDFLNDIGHNNDNAGLWTYDMSGKWQSTWRVLQTNFNAEYNFPIKGLSARGIYSYYYANQYLTNHEFTYKAYTYDPVDSTYNWTGGSSNPWQERGRTLINENDFQGQLNYQNSFGKHNLAATFVTEWYKRLTLYSWQHNVPPVNELDHILEPTIDNTSGYNDDNTPEARIGYIGRITYNYASKYYIEVSGRRDGSWRWPPEHRWGFFPSGSIGWRISKENFYTALFGKNPILNDLKIRVSYGKLGDDNTGIDPFAYVSGYNYPAPGSLVILDGRAVTPSVDRGEPITNITWFTSNITDIGADFSLWEGKLKGSVDYFYRKRTGLLASKLDVLIPDEMGYTLPLENVNSDAQMGEEISLIHNGQIGDLGYSISGNLSYSRSKFLHSFDPKFGNSWDKYRNSSEERWTGIFWGYQVVGQFKSQEEINNYPVNVDGQGNRTLLPGDFIYNDVNGDGVIDQYDQRPIGYNTGGQPSLYGGISITLTWKGFDFTSDFSYGSLYSYNRNWEARWPFQNGGSLLDDFTDRWHREDPRDFNSPWIPGKNPPLRFNDPSHSNYNKNSTWWLINITAFRLRTLELGYTIPRSITDRAKIKQVRIYLNGYNLFSLDNLKKQASFLDPEIASDNGLQYPQSKFLNVGLNLTF